MLQKYVQGKFINENFARKKTNCLNWIAEVTKHSKYKQSSLYSSNNSVDSVHMYKHTHAHIHKYLLKFPSEKIITANMPHTHTDRVKSNVMQK